VTAESASDLAAQPRTDDEIRSAPRAVDAFHFLELPGHQWAAVVSLLSLNYSVDFSGLQMNVSLIRPFPAQLVSTRGHLL
jgi:hypothetical protein